MSSSVRPLSARSERENLEKGLIPGETKKARMGRFRWRFSLHQLLALAVALLTVSGAFHLYSYGFFDANSGGGGSWQLGKRGSSSSSRAVASLRRQVESLQNRVGHAMEEIQRSMADEANASRADCGLRLRSEWKKSNSLLLDIAVSLDRVHSFLQLPASSSSSSSSLSPDVSARPWAPPSASSPPPSAAVEAGAVECGQEGQEPREGPLVDLFEVEEIRKYIRPKANRLGRKHFMDANATYAAIGHACAAVKYELEQYMDYDVGDYCADDWRLGQKLMVHGCDPLPRRRCFARGPKTYQMPLPTADALWALPDDRNVRWDKYICKGFKCLAGAQRKGFFKCSECFNLEGHEKPKWMRLTNTSTEADFLLDDVLGFKPGGIRIGLDFSVGVGTFAARMRERNVTIASATLNLGAPFNEFIALRGLLPLYLTVNQRLPFFDNTLDIVHSTLFLDGWIDHQLLDFVLLDWDRVIRPGGLIWIDRFFCKKEDLDDYLYYFEQLRYKRLRWVVTPKEDKDEGEVWFSAVLEKPPRPF